MKMIDLAEAKANLEQYAHECHEAPVIVAINGEPAFEISPLLCAGDDEFVSRLTQRSREFQDLLRQRDEEKQRGETVSAEAMRQEMLEEVN